MYFSLSCLVSSHVHLITMFCFKSCTFHYPFSVSSHVLLIIKFSVKSCTSQYQVYCQVMYFSLPWSVSSHVLLITKFSVKSCTSHYLSLGLECVWVGLRKPPKQKSASVGMVLYGSTADQHQADFYLIHLTIRHGKWSAVHVKAGT